MPCATYVSFVVRLCAAHVPHTQSRRGQQIDTHPILSHSTRFLMVMLGVWESGGGQTIRTIMILCWLGDGHLSLHAQPTPSMMRFGVSIKSKCLPLRFVLYAFHLSPLGLDIVLLGTRRSTTTMSGRDENQIIGT